MATTRAVICAAGILLIAAGIVFVVLAFPSLMRLGLSDESFRSEMLQSRIEASIKEHIVPRFRHLADAAGKLSVSTSNYCKVGDASSWRIAKNEFDQTVAAFAGVAHLRFGPLGEDTRTQRISFWPDPRGIVWRHLRIPLAKLDKALLEPGALSKQSVALQGLTALDILLAKQIPIGPNSQPRAKYKCKLVTVIAMNIRDIAAAVLADWTSTDGWAVRMLNAGTPGNSYKSRIAAATDLVKSALVGFQIIRDQQVMVLLGALDGKRKLSHLPYYRSGLSISYLRASIKGSCELVTKLDLLPLRSNPNEYSWLVNWLPNACHQLRKLSSKLKLPESSKDKADKKLAFELRQLRFYSNGLRQVIGRDLAPAVGMTIGFNELDGD